jgi:hypothetical protein
MQQRGTLKKSAANLHHIEHLAIWHMTAYSYLGEDSSDEAAIGIWIKVGSLDNIRTLC